MTPIQAVLFDKDGTLFDFGATWNGWAADVIAHFSDGDSALAQALARALRFDLGATRFLPDSPVIAGTIREAAEVMAPVLTTQTVAGLEDYLMRTSAAAPLVPAVPLAAFLDTLAARGLALGVMTNDTEYCARSHLRSAGVLEKFDFVAGADSGHGAKPAPGPLLAFCTAVGVAPDRAVMVGDSTHDLIAGRAAGMATVGVLTGMAPATELAPFADVVLENIGHLGDWLTG